MKKTVSKAFALAMAATMLLTACGGNGGNDTKPAEGGSNEAAAQDPKAITDLVLTRSATAELETFNTLYSQRGEDSYFLTNLWDGLLETDNKGKLVPAIAESWESPDGGKTWTFKIRDGVKWVDVNGEEKADCTAEDWMTGMEWVLNFHKNDSANTSMPREMIEGATEYYEYTKTLSKEEAYALTAGEGSKFREMVKMEAPDANTLTYHMTTNKPYFPTVATYGCLYPINAAMIEELGGIDNTRAMNNENMWYNGCYTMTEYIQGNTKTLTKNPLYWDKDCTLFNTVTYRMTESGDVAFQMYENGEIDYVSLSEANLKTITSDPNHKYADMIIPDVPSKYAYQFHFNWDKKKEDGTPDDNWNKAIANKAFRQSWYYGLDLRDYYKRTNALDPMACENEFFTMEGLCYLSDGTEYTELVRQNLGLPEKDHENMIRHDAAKAEELKKQAIEELTAIGVTFPVEIDWYISGGSQPALDSANVLADAFSNSLGDDYVKLNIKTYVSSTRNEVIVPHLFSITGNGWGADYGDPQNFLGQITYGDANAYYSENYSFINSTEETEWRKDLFDAYKEFTRLVEEADAIVDDMDARYTAYAKAEAYMLENVLTLPQTYGRGWALGRIDNTSRMYALYGSTNEKLKNIRTSVDGYTTEQARENEAKYK